MMNFESIGEILLSVCEILQPAKQYTVSESAEEFRFVNQPGAYVGPWQNSTTPMMVAPMDAFASRAFSGVVFVGPAQSGKTDSLVINTITYSVKCAPMDMMLVCPTMTAARDFSIRRIDRLHRHSDEVGKMLLPGADADNKFDKHYKNGMLLTLSWPTPTELAGKPIGRIVMTDFDRMPDDVDGDGNPYDLASKRTTTFGSYAMTLAESSPSRPIKDLKWVARTPHEAPPCEGIIGLYNRGNRQRWYWPCPDCSNYFEGNFKHLVYERVKGQSNFEIAQTVHMKCPHCGYNIHPDERDGMQQRGRWVADGQGVLTDGTVIGEAPRSHIASFWLNGVAATFTTWRKLLVAYLDACDDYERTHSEEALKKFYNNDLGEPYREKTNNDNLRLPESLKAQASRNLGERVVPEGVRFLLALCDVQKNMWVVQVFGILPGRPYDTVLVDRFEVKYSTRLNESDERLWVKPASYLEDWDKLCEEVMEKEYPLGDGSGRTMGIKLTGCDSGGKEGVTTMAYNFYRKLRKENKHRRFILIKGDATPGQPRARISYPDSSRRDAKAAARGDVPVLMLNPNLLKDDLNARLDVMEPGKGMYLMPDWLPDNFYAEMCAETRTERGWQNLGGARNEAWDLSYYCLGLCVSELVRIEGVIWENPPGWCAEWDSNDMIRMPEAEPRFANTIKSTYDFSKLAKSLA